MLYAILIIIFSVAAWILYHKIFHVVYFDLSSALIEEIIGSLVVGTILTVLVVRFWYIVVAILAIAIIIAIYRNPSQTNTSTNTDKENVNTLQSDDATGQNSEDSEQKGN